MVGNPGLWHEFLIAIGRRKPVLPNPRDIRARHMRQTELDLLEAEQKEDEARAGVLMLQARLERLRAKLDADDPRTL